MGCLDFSRLLRAIFNVALLIGGLSQFSFELRADEGEAKNKPQIKDSKPNKQLKPRAKPRLKRRPLPPLMPLQPKRPAPKKVVITDEAEGPESGLVTKVSTLSFGIQLIRNNGFTMQLPAYAKGAFNFGVGIVPFSVNIDLMQYFTLDFKYLPLDSIAVFHESRGKPLITAGLGFELGADNYFRAPGGIQYTFKEMPAQVFALLIILVGPFGGEEGLGINADVNLGFRVLL